MKVVCNGINPGDFPDEQLPTREADLVICVGRIEGIKNQLQLIRALNNSGFRLLIIGDPAPGHLAYYHACRAIAGDNVRFIAHLPQAELLVYYQTAKVHVLPSFFETTGLSSLEAGAMGCRIVVSNRGDVADYFGNYACYCEPDDAGSILQAVQTAAQQPLDWGLRELILHKYSWQKAARETEAAYKWVYEQKKSAHWHHGFTGHTQ
jgi:glycosyltransferase involved in cell wall biosynthesis